MSFLYTFISCGELIGIMGLEESKEALSEWFGVKVSSIRAMIIVVDIEKDTIDNVMKTLMLKSVTQPQFRLLGTNRLEVSMSAP